MAIDPLVPSTRLRRAWGNALWWAAQVLPRPWRWKAGGWRWKEILETHARHYLDGLDGAGAGPVARLVAIGRYPDGKASPWPDGFERFHVTWNWENDWRKLSPAELGAWARVWARHPRGQACLDAALAGVAQSGGLSRVDLLLAAGANPLAPPRPPSRGRSLLHAVWGAPSLSFDRKLAVWKRILAAGPAPGWEEWGQGDGCAYCARRYTQVELEAWKASGVPMPTGQAALDHALAWVDDPPLGDCQEKRKDTGQAIAAIAWLKRFGQLPPNAGTRLLQRFLETVRPGGEAYYQEAMKAWARELLAEGLPPRPPAGPMPANRPGGMPMEPALPWSHWAAHAIFFENLPQDFRERLFDEPDAWTALNAAGQDVAAVFAMRIHDVRSQSREADLEKLKPWLRARALEKALPQASEASRGPGIRPRL